MRRSVRSCWRSRRSRGHARAGSPDKDFVTGEGFDYLGRHYRLQLTDDPPGAGVELERGRLRMARAIAEDGSDGSAMIRWYRRRALAWLPRRIAAWAQFS
jgi:hypothetical protein